MAFVPFDDAAQVELRFLYAGQHVENVFHISKFGGWTVGDMDALGAVFVDWWDDAWKAYSPSTLTLESIKLKTLQSQADPGIEYVTGLPLTGTNASAQLPNNVTYAVKWGTQFTGRSFRGRTYHVGVCETQVTGNTLETSYRAQAIAAYADLIPRVTAAEAKLVVASRISNGIERGIGLVTDIISASVDPTTDSQRRRLPGRGQ